MSRILLLCALCLAWNTCEAQKTDLWDTFSDTWVARDGLGREVSAYPQTGPVRADKYVGLFYYIWHGQHGTRLFDIHRILQENSADPAWGPKGVFHHWGEPLYGYYLADDEYVIRKNVQMMADAGVDVIFFDVTNAVPYTSVYLTLCEIYMKMRNDGCRTPQVAFLTNSHSGKTAQTIYDDFYAKGLYQELWFYWDDKPLILAKEEELSDALTAFFTVRRSWAWDPGKDKWPWLEHSPQQGGWHDTPDVLEQMVAATAQHPTSHNRGLGLGKSFKNGVQPKPGQYESEQGYYFKEQLDHALAADPAFLFLTQWNEWIAQRFITDNAMTYAGQKLKPGDTYFVDVYSMEFNRDMEPMKGGYQDNYYYQMVDGIRRFKGTRDVPRPSPGKTIDLTQFDGWDDVLPEYRDDRGDVFHRDHPGYGDHHYTNQTGRNDLVLAKVTQDADSLFFFAQTREDLSEEKTENWMNLFIQIEGREAPHWEGYHYCIRFVDGECGLYACQQGWSWKKIRAIRHGLAPDRLAYAIAKSDIGVDAGFSLRFKWSDNMREREAMDWILNGDTAPNGRFQYLYRSESPTP